MEKLRTADVTKFAAKYVLRASSLSLSELKVFDWKIQNNEVEKGEALSPLLLVRRGKGKHLIIADRFHRLCAVFSYDKKATVFCKIV